MVHTFPNLSVLFSGRVHISLDNTGEGGAGVQTMLLHQITRVLSTLSAAASLPWYCHSTPGDTTNKYFRAVMKYFPGTMTRGKLRGKLLFNMPVKVFCLNLTIWLTAAGGKRRQWVDVDCYCELIRRGQRGDNIYIDLKSSSFSSSANWRPVDICCVSMLISTPRLQTADVQYSAYNTVYIVHHSIICIVSRKIINPQHQHFK